MHEVQVGLIAFAFVAFFLLQFTEAPYGRFEASAFLNRWYGPRIPGKIAWIVQVVVAPPSSLDMRTLCHPCFSMCPIHTHAYERDKNQTKGSRFRFRKRLLLVVKQLVLLVSPSTRNFRARKIFICHVKFSRRKPTPHLPPTTG